MSIFMIKTQIENAAANVWLYSNIFFSENVMHTMCSIC